MGCAVKRAFSLPLLRYLLSRSNKGLESIMRNLRQLGGISFRSIPSWIKQSTPEMVSFSNIVKLRQWSGSLALWYLSSLRGVFLVESEGSGFVLKATQ